MKKLLALLAFVALAGIGTARAQTYPSPTVQNLTVLGTPLMSGLASGTCASGLVLDSGGNVRTGSCPGGGGSVSITAGNAGIVFSPTPLTGTGTASLNITGGGASSNEWVSSISAAGVATLSQPAFSNLAGSASAAQMSTNLGAAVSTLCSASTTNFVRGDGTCVTPSGSGNVSTSGSISTGAFGIWASGTGLAGTVVPGTGVTTALAIAPGTTGSFPTQDGAITTGNCLKWGPGVQDNGSACGGTPAAFSATTTNSTNAYTLSGLFPSSGCALANAPTIHIVFNATNTGAATLTGCGGTTVPIVQQIPTGFVALVSGEIALNTERIVTYNVASTDWVLTNQVGSPVQTPCAGQTFSAAQWSAGLTCTVTASGQTFVFPIVSGLPANGGIFINSQGQSFTVTPGTGDGVNGNTVSTSIVFGPGNYQVACLQSGSTCEAAQTASLSVTGGSRKANPTLSWAPGQNLTAISNGLTMVLPGNEAAWTVVAVKCRIDAAAGATASAQVYYVTPNFSGAGTAYGSGTAIATTPCNGNGTALEDQNMGVASATIPAGDDVGVVFTGTGFGSSGSAAGAITLTLQ